MSSEFGNANNMIDDIWIKIFVLLNTKDLLSVNTTSKRCDNLTNPSTNYIINCQWKFYCTCVCPDINASGFNFDNWYTSYKKLFSCIVNISVKKYNAQRMFFS